MDVTPQPDPTLPWVKRLLLRVEVGSTAHGTGLPGKEDYDELGIMSMPTSHYVGVPIPGPQADTIVYRPGRGDHDRSGPGDYDLQVYAARKAVRLMADGNPSALMMLFGPVRYETALGAELRSDEMVDAFWSLKAKERFLGYARSQRERLMGLKGGRHTNRPELEAVHGYDTKYAMHMLRLGIQGIEYMETGRITCPMPEEHAEFLRAVRRGEHDLDEVLRVAYANEERLASEAWRVPAEPYWDKLNEWLYVAAIHVPQQRWTSFVVS